MKSCGLGLLYSMVTDEVPLSEVLKSGISRKFLINEEQKVYDFVYSFFRDYGNYPSVKTVEVETGVSFDGFPREPFAYWVRQVFKRRSLRIAVTTSQYVMDQARDGNTDTAIETARKLYLALEKLNPSAVVHKMTDTSQQVLDRHDTLQRAGSLVFGVSFGFPYFDEISGGAQEGDFIPLVGRPGTGKSFFLFKMANAAHDANRKPALVTFEMPALQCARRIVGMRSQVSTSQLRIGRLSYFGRKKVVQACNLIANETGWEFPIIEGSNRYTVEDLIAIVQDLGADSLFVDGAYFLKTQSKTTSKFEQVSNVADKLKTDAAMGLKIPVVATYQFNKRAGKKGGGLGDIYMSDDMAQLGSIVFKLYNEDDGDEAAQYCSWHPVTYKIVELLKGREGEQGKIRVLYDMMNTNIEQVEVLADYRNFFQTDK